MAERRAGKASPRSAEPRGSGRHDRTKAASRKANSPVSEAALGERLQALECECKALRAELELERARRRALEEVHAATRDRISWALDSLQSILNSKMCDLAKT
jgi:hypothetical protein